MKAAYQEAKTILTEISEIQNVYAYPYEFHLDTTLTIAITAGSDVTVTPATMEGVFVGSKLKIEDEAITVKSITATTFTADIVTDHDADVSIVDNLDLETVPFIVLSPVANVDNALGTAGDASIFTVRTMLIKIVLAVGHLTTDKDFKEAILAEETILELVTDKLAANQTLNGVVDFIGEGKKVGKFFDRWVVGGIHVGTSIDFFWGISAILHYTDYRTVPMSR